jgi:xylulokinase
VCSENIIRSAVEGATFALRFGLNELAQLGVSANQIVLTGGGANSEAWRQIVADVCNAPVIVLKNNEGAGFGAALQAVAMVEGSNADLESLVNEHLQPDPTLFKEPDSTAVDFYEDVYATYQQCAEKIAELYS